MRLQSASAQTNAHRVSAVARAGFIDGGCSGCLAVIACFVLLIWWLFFHDDTPSAEELDQRKKQTAIAQVERQIASVDRVLQNELALARRTTMRALAETHRDLEQTPPGELRNRLQEDVDSYARYLVLLSRLETDQTAHLAELHRVHRKLTVQQEIDGLSIDSSQLSSYGLEESVESDLTLKQALADFSETEIVTESDVALVLETLDSAPEAFEIAEPTIIDRLRAYFD